VVTAMLGIYAFAWNEAHHDHDIGKFADWWKFFCSTNKWHHLVRL
jgi:hypothetical protein